MAGPGVWGAASSVELLERLPPGHRPLTARNERAVDVEQGPRLPAASLMGRGDGTPTEPTAKEAEVDERSEERPDFPEPTDGLLTAPETGFSPSWTRPTRRAAAIDELASTGCDRDEIFVLCGPRVPSGSTCRAVNHGLRGRTYRIMEWIGDEREGRVGSGEHLASGRARGHRPDRRGHETHGGAHPRRPRGIRDGSPRQRSLGTARALRSTGPRAEEVGTHGSVITGQPLHGTPA